MGLHIMMRTPDPAFLIRLDSVLEGHAARMLDTEVFRGLRMGRYGVIADRFRAFQLQVGSGIVEWFHMLLVELRDRVFQILPREEDLTLLLWKFLNENAHEELHHDEYWLEQAAAFGIDPKEFVAVILRPAMQALCDYLLGLAQHGEIAHALVAINYTVEGMAGKVTASIGPAFLGKGIPKSERLTKAQRRWLLVHFRADKVHAADARELIKRLLNYQIDFTALKAIVDKTADLFIAALVEAYAVAMGASDWKTERAVG